DTLSGLTRLYTHGDDLISQSRITGGNPSNASVDTYLYDGLGSVRALTTATGTTSDTYTYLAFGELDNQNGTTANNYLYTGEQYDPNVGFYYLRARYYNPSIGRFQTMDTYAGRMHEPQTLHKYLYVHADPVNNIDPSGLKTLQTLAAGARVVRNLFRSASSSASAIYRKIAKNKIYTVDIYVRTQGFFHAFLYLEKIGLEMGLRYDIDVLGDRKTWFPSPGVVRSRAAKRSSLRSRKIARVAKLSFPQWMLWHATVIGPPKQSQ
ncbi:MAG: RHS repeat-associated core domain-containing protein, partial [Cyanobacteria bacterium J06555_13]